jgi:hypothetical protein
MASWIQRLHDGHVRVVGVEIDPQERIGRSFQLSPPVSSAALPSVEVQDDGATVVWWRAASVRSTRWFVRTQAPHGSFAPTAELPGLGGHIAASLDEHGNVLALMMTCESPLTSCQYPFAVFSAVWPVGGQPHPSLLDRYVVPRDTPRIAIDPTGRALAVWSGDVPASTAARISERLPGGDFGAVQAAPPSSRFYPQLLALADGSFLLICGSANSGKLTATIDQRLSRTARA